MREVAEQRAIGGFVKESRHESEAGPEERSTGQIVYGAHSVDQCRVMGPHTVDVTAADQMERGGLTQHQQAQVEGRGAKVGYQRPHPFLELRRGQFLVLGRAPPQRIGDAQPRMKTGKEDLRRTGVRAIEPDIVVGPFSCKEPEP